MLRCERWRPLGVAVAVVVAGSCASLLVVGFGGQAKATGGTVSALSVGATHSCALLSDGAVKCWGRNRFGELGSEIEGFSAKPVAVNSLPHGVIAIAAGAGHTCALVRGGAVVCWGRNLFGELGDGTRNDSSIPVPVSGLQQGVIAISGIGEHTCALLRGGSVKCWGNNEGGQLGNGRTGSSSTPVAVRGLQQSVIAISAGRLHTCALLKGGAVECWGFNDDGRVGNGTTKNSSKPVPVKGLQRGVVAISAGGLHTCALLRGGAAKCWGWNAYGQLGNGEVLDFSSIPTPPDFRATPVAVKGLQHGVVAISAANVHTCALLQNGTAKCWGDNEYGQLGNRATKNSATPVAVKTLRGIATIVGGWVHTCALLRGSPSAPVKCWGDNAVGELGNGTTNPSLTPVPVTGL